MQMLGRTGEVITKCREPLGLTQHLAHQLAILEHLHIREFLEFAFDQVAKLAQQAGPLGGQGVRPIALFESKPGCGHRRVHVGYGRGRYTRPGKARIGIDAVEPLAIGRIDPLAIDMHPVGPEIALANICGLFHHVIQSSGPWHPG